MLRLIVFALFTIVTQGLIHYYLWRRLVRDTRLPAPWRGRATVAIIILGLSMPVTMALTRTVSISVGQTLGWPAFLWMGLSGLTLAGLLVLDAARLVSWPARALARRRAAADAERTDLGRRAFMARMAGGAVVTAATGSVGVGCYEVQKPHEIVDVPITLSRLPASMDGFRIVQLTDIHVGFTVTRSFVEDLVERTNAADPDVIAITGDLVDGDVPSLARAVAPLAHLHAPHGVYFVTGNHEYYAGADEWIAELERLGIHVLRNERVSIARGQDSFDLAGIDDHDAAKLAPGHGADVARALKGRDSRRELVLLAHQPRQVREVSQYDVGLQLSGHTHGGQVWPWHYLASAQQGGLLAGLSRHGDTQLYISRGAGYWGPPIRVAAPAEITRVILRAPRDA